MGIGGHCNASNLSWARATRTSRVRSLRFLSADSRVAWLPPLPNAFLPFPQMFLETVSSTKRRVTHFCNGSFVAPHFVSHALLSSLLKAKKKKKSSRRKLRDIVIFFSYVVSFPLVFNTPFLEITLRLRRIAFFVPSKKR